MNSDVPADPATAPNVAGLDVERGRVLKRLASNPAAMIGMMFLVVVIVAAVLAPWITPHDPAEQDLLRRLEGPGRGNLLGTDEFGRDQLSRLMYGARTSLLAAAEAVGIATGVGLPLGMVAGFSPRRIDSLLSRVNDALMSVPALLMALTVVAVLGPGLHTSMLAVGIISIPRMFRVTRAATLTVRTETYIEASEALGCSKVRTVMHHVLPNILTPVVVTLAISLGSAVTAEASLSFIGLGVRPPTASWGSMLTSASSNMIDAPHLVYVPGIMIAATVLAFALVGDGLAQALGTSRQAVAARGV